MRSITRRGTRFFERAKRAKTEPNGPERSEGRERSPVGAYTMYPITRKGPKRRRREGRVPQARGASAEGASIATV